MTSGEGNGTSGGTSLRQPGPLALIAIVTFVVVTVNSTSDYLDLSRSGADFDWWEPFVWEASSALIIVAMAPFVGAAVRRWTPGPENWLRPLAIHLGLTIPFSLIHIVAIFLLRNLIYWLLSARYGFFDDGVGLVLLYEWRKDVLTYAAIAAFYWVFDYIAARRANAASQQTDDGRIEVRDGGSAVFLAPADILFVEAAGNYIEFHTAARAHLVRGTLAAWEARLATRGFARVHRSRLVNRARIAAIKPTASGDLEITLDDGRTLAGSRRYREALDAAR